MVKGNLNLDLYESISLLKAMAKKFFLKEEYHPFIFKSKGLEFEGYRKYSYSDDASLIDWKASQRTKELMIRQFKQERELRVAFFIDSGSNMVFGSTKKIKCEYAAEVSAAMATLIIESNNLLSFLFFADEVKFFNNFYAGKKQLHLFYDNLASGKNYGGRSNLSSALDYAIKYFNNDVSTIFLVSDFLSLDDSAIKKLQLVAHKFDVVAFKITDPLDKELPDINQEVFVQDPGTNRQLLVNPKVAKKDYDFYAEKRHRYIIKNLRDVGVDIVELDTSEPFAHPMAMFLKKRMYEVM